MAMPDTIASINRVRQKNTPATIFRPMATEENSRACCCTSLDLE